MKRIIFAFVVLIFVFQACKTSENSNKNKIKENSKTAAKLPSSFYKHLTGTYFNMPASIDFMVIDSFAYITLTYGKNYKTICATVDNFKHNKFSYFIRSNLKSFDTLEQWQGKFVNDSTLDLEVIIPIRDTTYRFTENYKNAIRLDVTRFDTTLFYKNTDKELFIYTSNSLTAKNLSFDFMNTASQLRKIYDTVVASFAQYFSTDNPDSKNYFYPLSSNRLMTVQYNNNNLLVISDNNYQFFGGAHGINWINYYNIDLKNRQLLNISDVFTDTLELKNLIYKFLKKKNITLLVSEENMSLTDNFYICGSSIHFVYNPYEIAPYTAGVIDVKFDFKKLLKYLNTSFLKQFFPTYNFQQNQHKIRQ